MGLFDSLFKEPKIDINHDYLDSQIEISITNYENEYNEYQDYLKKLEYEKKHSFNGESSKKIAKKLNRYLNSTLKGKGEFITEYSIKVGMDPYLATAVMLQETGCYWTCSGLTRQCNNVGGNKGTPSCNGGSYRRFDTIEDGIKFAINTLSKYYKNGKTTPEQIGPKYASDPKWPTRVNNYIKKLKNG